MLLLVKDDFSWPFDKLKNATPRDDLTCRVGVRFMIREGLLWKTSCLAK